MPRSTNSAGRRRGLPTRVKSRHSSHFVEELTTRQGSPIGRLVPLSQVEPDPGQPRSSMGDLSDLVSSVESKGILEPILVRLRPGATEERYRIISGERRYHAAMEAGLFEVPVIELDVDDDEALEIALIENLHRKDLTPFEEAEGYRSLADRFDYTHEKISEVVGKSRTVVTESLSLLSMPPRAREAVEALGITTRSILLEVLKAGTEDEMIRLLEQVANRGLSRDDLRRQSRNRTASGKPRRRKPYTFNFRAPDKSFRLSLSFRRHTVDRTDLISALEEILEDLRAASDDEKPAT